MRRAFLLLVSLTLIVLPVLAEAKKISDDQIYDNVRRRLANDPDVKGGALEVDVKQGAVTIKGKVKTDKARQKAEKLCHKVKGVTTVQNQIVVDPT